MNPHPTELEREQRRELRPTLTKWSYFLTMAATVSYGLARSFIRRDDLSVAPKVALAVTASLLIGLAFWRIERELLASHDEMERRIRLEAALLALPVIVSCLFLLGLLHRGGMIMLRPEQAGFATLFAYLGSLAFVRHRYR